MEKIIMNDFITIDSTDTDDKNDDDGDDDDDDDDDKLFIPKRDKKGLIMFSPGLKHTHRYKTSKLEDLHVPTHIKDSSTMVTKTTRATFPVRRHTTNNTDDDDAYSKDTMRKPYARVGKRRNSVQDLKKQADELYGPLFAVDSSSDSDCTILGHSNRSGQFTTPCDIQNQSDSVRRKLALDALDTDSQEGILSVSTCLQENLKRLSSELSTLVCGNKENNHFGQVVTKDKDKRNAVLFEETATITNSVIGLNAQLNDNKKDRAATVDLTVSTDDESASIIKRTEYDHVDKDVVNVFTSLQRTTEHTSATAHVPNSGIVCQNASRLPKVISPRNVLRGNLFQNIQAVSAFTGNPARLTKKTRLSKNLCSSPKGALVNSKRTYDSGHSVNTVRHGAFDVLTSLGEPIDIRYKNITITPKSQGIPLKKCTVNLDPETVEERLLGNDNSNCSVPLLASYMDSVAENDAGTVSDSNTERHFMDVFSDISEEPDALPDIVPSKYIDSVHYSDISSDNELPSSPLPPVLTSYLGEPQEETRVKHKLVDKAVQCNLSPTLREMYESWLKATTNDANVKDVLLDLPELSRQNVQQFNNIFTKLTSTFNSFFADSKTSPGVDPEPAEVLDSAMSYSSSSSSAAAAAAATGLPAIPLGEPLVPCLVLTSPESSVKPSSADSIPRNSSSTDSRPPKSSAADSTPTHSSSADCTPPKPSLTDFALTNSSSADSTPTNSSSAGSTPTNSSSADSTPTNSSSADCTLTKLSSADCTPPYSSSVDLIPPNSSSAAIEAAQKIESPLSEPVKALASSSFSSQKNASVSTSHQSSSKLPSSVKSSLVKASQLISTPLSRKRKIRKPVAEENSDNKHDGVSSGVTLPLNHKYVLNCCFHDNDIMLSYFLHFLEDFSAKYTIPNDICQTLMRVTFFDDKCETSTTDLNRSCALLKRCSKQNESIIEIKWEMIEDSFEVLVGVNKSNEHDKIQRSSLFLKLAVDILENDLHSRNVTNMKDIRRSSSYKLLSQDMSSQNRKRLLYYISQALHVGQHDTVSKQGEKYQQQHPEILNILMDLLSLCVEVSTSSVECASTLAPELARTYSFLADLENKEYMISSLGTSSILQYKLVQTVLQSQYEECQSLSGFPDSLHTVILSFFKARPLKYPLTPPTTPTNENPLFHGDQETHCSVRDTQEIAMLLFYIVRSYLQTRNDKSYIALRWRSRCKVNKMQENDLEELKVMDDHVERLLVHLYTLSSELSDDTHQYLDLIRCFAIA